MDSVRSRLIQLREDNGLSKVEMAQKLGVSKSAITRYETGEMRPTFDIMLKIKQIFGVTLDWIAGFDDDGTAAYSNIISECKKSDISPDKLKQIIKVLKE
jgi:transcriptional regulator with XRE-family HTH domain